jgi:tetratricopeptide (TPR) repeat protein
MDDVTMDKRPDRDLLEKYFHSRGAVSYGEGKWTSAIRFFRKALALADMPYTRCHLGLTYAGKGDLDRALREMTKAVRLAPSVAEYRFQRADLWRLKGDGCKADADLDAACRIDPNYRRIKDIRKAAAAVQSAFTADEGRVWPEREAIRDGRLGTLVEGARASAEARRAAVEGRSCLVPCPAYCCHFRGRPVLHGLYITPWKLQAVRGYLKERGMKEDVFLARLPFGREEEKLCLIPPHAPVKDRGERVVFYPGQGEGRLPDRLVPGLPRTIDYRELAWITREARPCAFLAEGRCLIHDSGGDPALPACKEFLCLTGYVFLVLDWLGFLPASRLQLGAMEDLNAVAVDALLALSERLFGNDRLGRREEEMTRVLGGAVDADKRGEPDVVRSSVEGYRVLEKRWNRAFSRATRLLEGDLDRLVRDRRMMKTEGERP